MENVELYKALAKARMEFTKVKFDSVNPHFKNSFASLASMHEATIEALSANGLIITQLPTDLDGRFALKTVLAHVSGGSIETTLPMPPVKNDPHGIGGAISYSRRYMYGAILNIVGEEDDDGELAMGNTETIKKSEQRKPNLNDDQVSDLKKKIESGNWSLDACKEKWRVNHLADVSQEQYQRIMSKKSEEKANESATA